MADKVKGSDKPWLKNYKLGPYPLRKTLEPYPKAPICKFLDDSAEAYPGQVAIEYLGRRIRYHELKEYVNRFANALASLGLKKGDKVASVLPNCPQFIINDFAVSKMGAALIPCSTLHKVLDLEYEIGESGAETVVCSDEALSVINSIKAKTKLRNVIVTSPLDYSSTEPEVRPVPGAHQFKDLIKQHEANPPHVDIDPVEDLAYLAFTGGATGVPKGVMITHYNRACNVRQGMWLLEPLWPGMKGKAATEILIPLFHAYGHLGMQVSIAMGMRILLVSDPRDIDQAVNLLKENRPMIVYVVPTHLMKIAERKVGRLPVMFLSGAAPLPEEVFQKIKRDILMPVSEGYGLTECGPLTHANLTTFSKITGFISKDILGIGLPVPDTEARILDLETGQELGAGESGEIAIRGPQTMKGYWPKAGSGLDEGWLHTGDIGRMDENGHFVLEDRIKDMANISGLKVYTTVVDEVLFKYPGVAMAAAVGIPDPERPGSERIKAFIKPREEYKGKLNAAEIIAYCRDKLPANSVPKYVEFRDNLPLTVTEKIFKRSLREEEIKKMKKQGILKQRGNKEGKMIPYATPEWVAEVGKNYKANPDNQNKIFKSMTLFLSFRILADSKFGIDKDIYFSSHLVNGALQDDSALLSKEDAEKKSDFVLAASPEIWKRLIQKRQGFVSLVMTKKIKLDRGLAPKLLSLAPKSGPLIELFNKVDTEWPDEMSPQRLEQYKAQVKEFRERFRV